MEHIGDGPAGRDRIDCDLLMTAILGKNAYKRVNGTLRA